VNWNVLNNLRNGRYKKILNTYLQSVSSYVPPHVSSMRLVIRPTSTTMNPYGKTGRHSAIQKNSLSLMEGVFTWSWYSQENPFRILASVCMTLVSFLFSHLCSDVICNFSTAIGLLPGGSSTVHIYTHTIHRTTQLNNWEGCGPCPVFASYTLAFALQLRKRYGKPQSV